MIILKNCTAFIRAFVFAGVAERFMHHIASYAGVSPKLIICHDNYLISTDDIIHIFDIATSENKYPH